jgi:hypothetical protein
LVIKRVCEEGGGGCTRIWNLGNGSNGISEEIVFSDLYSPSMLVVAEFKNVYVFRISPFGKTRSPNVYAEEAAVIMVNACLLQIVGIDCH